MAAPQDKAAAEEALDAADLQAAVCVLAGSDPENCSYSRVGRALRGAPSAVAIRPRLAASLNPRSAAIKQLDYAFFFIFVPSMAAIVCKTHVCVCVCSPLCVCCHRDM